MNNTQGQSEKLERTLGLPTALTIGIGTRVGAGIFVFPGIAAGGTCCHDIDKIRDDKLSHPGDIPGKKEKRTGKGFPCNKAFGLE